MWPSRVVLLFICINCLVMHLSSFTSKVASLFCVEIPVQFYLWISLLICWCLATETVSFPVKDKINYCTHYSSKVNKPYMYLDCIYRLYVSPVSLAATLLSANIPPSSLNTTHGASLASYYRCDKCTIMAQLSQNAKFHSKGKEVGCD